MIPVTYELCFSLLYWSVDPWYQFYFLFSDIIIEYHKYKWINHIISYFQRVNFWITFIVWERWWIFCKTQWWGMQLSPRRLFMIITFLLLFRSLQAVSMRVIMRVYGLLWKGYWQWMRQPKSVLIQTPEDYGYQLFP